MRTFHIPVPYTNYRITGWGLGLMLGICAAAALAQMSKSQMAAPQRLPQARLEIYYDDTVSHAILYVTGIGHAAKNRAGESQGRVMALRAARVNGYRNLLQALHPNRRIIQTGVEHTDGFLKGAALFDQKYHTETGTAEATIAYFFQTGDDEIHYLLKQGLEPEPITAEDYIQRKKQATTIDESEWKQWQRQ